MSELEARKYMSIRNLREEIRQDMEDYKLLCFKKEEWFIFNNDHDNWFFNYLRQQINKNIKTLKAEAKLIKKELQPAIDEIKAYEQYIKDLKDLISYILNLPANLQKIFAQCLTEALSSLKTAISAKDKLTDQTAALTAAQQEVQSAIDSKTDVANGNTSTVELELS